MYTHTHTHTHTRASLVAQLVKNPSAMWETWVQSVGWEDSLEKGKATHSSILAWRIPWTVHRGVAKSQTQLRDLLSLHFIYIYIYMTHPRVWNGYPLQYSCLEGPMDRGTWQDTVHRVAQNRTQLSTYTQICSVQLLSHVQLSVTPWTVWSLPGSSVHGILQAWILEWVAISFSRGSSQPKDQTSISYIICISWQVLYH